MTKLWSCVVRGLCWPCQSIRQGQPWPATTHPQALRSPPKICYSNPNNLHRQHLHAWDKIEKEIVEIPQSVGMQQGNNIVPVLFLFLMTAFAETLEIIWREQEIPLLSVMTASKDNLINWKICSHTPAMFTLKTLTAYKILQCLYVDDGAFPFGTREDIKKGVELVYHHFGSDWKCISDKGRHSPKPSASSSPPPSSFNTHSAVLRLLQQSNEPFVVHTPAITQHR